MIFIAGKKASGKDTIANSAVALGCIAEPSTKFHVVHPAKTWVMKTFQVSEDRYDAFRSKHRVYIQQRASEVLRHDPTVLLRIISDIPHSLRRGAIVVGIRFLHERDYAHVRKIPTVLIDTPDHVRSQRLAARGEVVHGSAVPVDEFERELHPRHWDYVLDGSGDIQQNALKIVQWMLAAADGAAASEHTETSAL